MEKQLVKNGNSLALVLDQTLLQHLGVENRVEVLMLKDRIVIMKPGKKLPVADKFIDRIRSKSIDL
jgi:antitoxin component of MazEF toxin-antitoxin module